MKTTHNDDGTTSYTLTQAERAVLWAFLGYFYGKRVGYTRGRMTMAKEFKHLGAPQP